MYRAVVLALLVAGCRAELIGNDRTTDASSNSTDAPASLVDAPVAQIDAPVDARLCAGGDARQTAPDGSCIVFFNTPRTHADAAAACVQLNARLLVIKDTGTDEIARMLAGTLDVFMGLSDAANENTFVWVDGTTASYTNWRLGEPNNGNGNFEEDCGIINGVRGGKWDDRPCATDPNVGVLGEYPYLCQY